MSSRCAAAYLVATSILLISCQGLEDFGKTLPLQGDDTKDIIDDFRGLNSDTSTTGSETDTESAGDSAHLVRVEFANFETAHNAAQICTVALINENVGGTAFASSTNCTTASKLYFQAGLALSDQICHYFFDLMQNAQTGLSQSRDVSNVLGTFTAALMGAFSAGSAVTGTTAAGFNLIEGSLDATVANYIVAPNVGEVEDLLFRSRRALAATYVDTDTDNYYKARRQLENYHATCSPSSIRNLVSAAFNKASERVEEPKQNSLVDLAVGSIGGDVIELYKDNGVAVVIDQNDLLSLYAVLIKGELLKDASLVQRRTALQSKSLLTSDSGEANVRSVDRDDLLSMLRYVAAIAGFDDILASEMKTPEVLREEQDDSEETDTPESDASEVQTEIEPAYEPAAQSTGETAPTTLPLLQ